MNDCSPGKSRLLFLDGQAMLDDAELSEDDDDARFAADAALDRRDNRGGMRAGLLYEEEWFVVGFEIKTFS